MKRRRYTKPQLKKVELTPEEAVLVVCKTSSGDTAKNGACRASTGAACCKDSQGS